MEPKTFDCPKCAVAFRHVRTVFEARGVIVKDAEAYRCPRCNIEIFSSEQVDKLQKVIYALAPPVLLKRKISSAAGKKPMVYLPPEILEAMKLKIGDSITFSIAGSRRAIIVPT